MISLEKKYERYANNIIGKKDFFSFEFKARSLIRVPAMAICLLNAGIMIHGKILGTEKI